MVDAEACGGYSSRMKTVPHLLAAIECGGLSATSDLHPSGRPEIILLIKDQAFCRLGCLNTGSPTVSVVDGKVVRISASPGIQRGFQITCDTLDDANTIADALQELIDDVYPNLFT